MRQHHPKDMDERRTLLLGAVQALVRTAELHAQDTLPLEKVLEATADVCELFGDGDVPGSCRELARGSEILEAEYRRFMELYEVNPDDAGAPGQPFWKSVERMRDLAKAAKPRQPLRLEPVATLVAQKVPEGQICRMYGWMNDDGVPEVWKLAEELARPGTHVTADFIPPKERILQERERAEERIKERVWERMRAKSAKKDGPAPESVEQLLKEGVSLTQMIRMTKLTREEINAEADRLGLPRPDEQYASPQSARGAYEKPLPDEDNRAIDAQQKNPTKGRSQPAAKGKGKGKAKGKPAPKAKAKPGGALDEQIAALAESGLDADAILDELAANPAVTIELIERVLGVPA